MCGSVLYLCTKECCSLLKKYHNSAILPWISVVSGQCEKGYTQKKKKIKEILFYKNHYYFSLLFFCLNKKKPEYRVTKSAQLQS